VCIEAETSIFGLERGFEDRDGNCLATLVVDAKVEYDFISTPNLKGDVVDRERERATDNVGNLKYTDGVLFYGTQC
jgi:hypothetical protein